MSAHYDPPLEDVTVIDITQVVAGPFATMNLGDLGAEDIKIEAAGRRDRSRSIRPIPKYFDTINRNKRSIEVNLKSDAGVKIVRELVAEADIFIESAKPGRMASFHLAYEDLRTVNTALIYCSISGFDRDSPYEELPAWDMLIQAMSGIMSITGEQGGQPLWSGLPSGDLITTMYTTQSVIAVLYVRERGVINSEWVEVPMLDAAISWLSARAGHTFGFDEPFPRLGTRHPTISLFGVYSCADESIVIAGGTDSLFEELCRDLEREDHLTDDRFATGTGRAENYAALDAEIEAVLETDTADAWVDRLQAERVSAGPIYDTQSVWEDEHVERRGLHQIHVREDQERALATLLNGVHDGYLPPTVSIYGPPGTGKTLTTRRVCREFASPHEGPPSRTRPLR